jgi:hypothetical protein
MALLYIISRATGALFGVGSGAQVFGGYVQHRGSAKMKGIALQQRYFFGVQLRTKESGAGLESKMTTRAGAPRDR